MRYKLEKENATTSEMSKEEYLEMVKGAPNRLNEVPVEFRTEEMCRIAVTEGRGMNLQYVPDEVCTEEMCLAAVNQHGKNLEYVPERFRTEEIYTVAVKSYPRMLKEVPKEYLTKELCETAVKTHYSVIEYVPKDMVTAEMCFTAIDKGYDLKALPKDILFDALDAYKEKEKAKNNEENVKTALRQSILPATIFIIIAIISAFIVGNLFAANISDSSKVVMLEGIAIGLMLPVITIIPVLLIKINLLNVKINSPCNSERGQ